MSRYSYIPLRFIVAFICLSIVLPVAAQTPLPLNAQELWHFGRGVINDFNWMQSELQLATSNGVWQIEPTNDQALPHTPSETEIFHLSTSPDGTHFISYDSGNFLLWDAQTNTVVTTIKPGAYAENDAISWQFTSNSRL